MGWPLRAGRSTASSAARSSIRWHDLVTLGMVVGLDYRDVELSVHDLLQELKTTRCCAGCWRAGARRVGREDDRKAGSSLPRRLHARA
jgi:hypothetical protein